MALTIEPTDNDILLGRFKQSSNHPGNISFRTLINDNVDFYMQAYTRREKGVVIKGLYNQLISQGRRFLIQYGKQWVDVSCHSISRDKVSHASRDAALTHFKKGILGNVWESAQQQLLSPSKIKSKRSKKRDQTNTHTNAFRKVTALMKTTQITVPICDVAQYFELPSLMPVVVPQRKYERGCEQCPFSTLLPAPCIESQFTDQCDVTPRFSFSTFTDTVTVASSIGIGLLPFHDVVYDSLDMTKNESLCRSALVEPTLLQYSGVEDQNSTTESLLSMYDILRYAFDLCSDGDDFLSEELETWEDTVANPLMPPKRFGGVSGMQSEEDQFEAYVIK